MFAAAIVRPMHRLHSSPMLQTTLVHPCVPDHPFYTYVKAIMQIGTQRNSETWIAVRREGCCRRAQNPRGVGTGCQAASMRQAGSGSRLLFHDAAGISRSENSKLGVDADRFLSDGFGMVVHTIALPLGCADRRHRVHRHDHPRIPHNTLPSLSRPSRAVGCRGRRGTDGERFCGSSPQTRRVRWLPALRTTPGRGDWIQDLAAARRRARDK